MTKKLLPLRGQDIPQDVTVLVLLGDGSEGQEISLKCITYSSLKVYNYKMAETRSSHLQYLDTKNMGPLSDGANYVFIESNILFIRPSHLNVSCACVCVHFDVCMCV